MAPEHDQIPDEAASDQQCHRIDSHFIPVRPRDLVETLRQDAGPDATELPLVAELIERIIGQETLNFEKHLAELYAEVNPDRECLRLHADEPGDHLLQQLLTGIEHLLGKANFRRLDDIEVTETLKTARTYGLRIRIRPEAVESMSLWIRGRSTMLRRFRTLRHPIRGEERLVEVYQRLVVVVRLAGETSVRIKHFREIPITDVEALLPHAEVRMNLIDKLKVVGGSAGAIGATAIKLAKLMATVAVFSQVLWVLLAGCGVLLVRGLLGYRSARHMRLSQRTQHLYYQNLANNEAALHTLIRLIAYEEIKEAILGYALLRCPDPPRSPSDLAAAAATYLQRKFGVDVTFDIDDAVETLDRLDAWADRGTFTVVDPATLITRLEAHVRDARSAAYHVDQFSPGPGSRSPAP